MRLYDGAWVRTDGSDDKPVQAIKNKRNAATFEIGSHPYDIDGRPSPADNGPPALVGLLSLSDVRELGLPLHADRGIKPVVGRRMK